MEKRAQSMLQFAIFFCVARTWKSENYFHEVNESGSVCVCVVMDGIFAVFSSIFGLLFGVESTVSG